MTLPPDDDWSDDRLDAAFAARAAATPATPVELADEVHRRIATAERLRVRWPWLAGAAAAVAIVVIVAGSSLIVSPQPSPSIPAAAASGQPPASSLPPDPSIDLLAALGGTRTVSEAIEVRDTGDDRELAIDGFLSPVPEGVRCRAEIGPVNPTLLKCPLDMQWLMEEPEQPFPSSPDGPATRLSFALVDAPVFAAFGEANMSPVPVVLIGHFNDRRANLCDRLRYCLETFMVDRVVEVDGEELEVSTARRITTTTKDLADDVDALAIGAAPGAIVVSRQLLGVGDAIDIEPVLANDGVVPNWDPSAPFWLVTAVDLADDVPIARTFGLIDGSNWFAEITNESAIYLERTGPPPASGAPPVMPSGDPSAFDGAPTSILGIPVRDIPSIQRDRAAAMDQLGRDEFAIRAWYLGPNPAVSCTEAPPPIREPRPPCDEARHWLLDDPSQFGVEPGQSRSNPSLDHYTPVLNPLLPIDVAFEVGETWREGVPSPRPVIVLGHFADHRVDTYAGNLYFVIDALAWTPDRSIGSFDRVVRLTTSATEDVGAVLDRIVAVDPRVAVATWVAVADAADFVRMDRRTTQMPEFASGAPVWMVARLIHDQRDDRERLGVVWGFTADNGSRVWFEECPDCSPDLGTTLDIVDLDENTPLVRVFDYSQAITSVGRATGLSGLSWQQPHGNTTDFLDVAQGRTPREVVLRWMSPADCPGPWNITVHRVDDERFDGNDIYISPSIRGEGCEGETITRRIVIEFEDPVDIDRIEGPSCCG